MKFSAQEEYGLRFLMQLARHGDDASLTIHALARLEGITMANAAKMMRLLRRTGFVRSTRGQTGGYTLARPARAIVIGDVLVSLGSPLFDESFCDRHSGVEGPCAHAGDCSLRPFLRRVQDAVDQVMGRLTLHDLLCRNTEDASNDSRAVPLQVVSTSARTAGG
jgi:Rrf2 family protein